jgi:hypothetical protein
MNSYCSLKEHAGLFEAGPKKTFIATNGGNGDNEGVWMSVE